MTNEEALEQMKEWHAMMTCDPTNKNPLHLRYVKTVEMAIKALEQADVLDKVRAEIMDFEEELFHRPNTDYTDYAAVRHCVEIIDKYKAESEKKPKKAMDIINDVMKAENIPYEGTDDR